MIAALFHNRPLRRRLVAGSIAILACGAAMVWHGARSEASNAKPAAPEMKLVKAMAVAPTRSADTRTAVGEIRPRLESDLGFRVSGKLLERIAEIGSTVKKGEVLARIEDQDYRNRLASAEADVAAAQAVLVEASAAEVRIGALLAKGFTTRATYDATLKNLRSAQAKLKSANIAFEMAKDQVAYTELHAEFDGIVTATGAEAGQSVAVGQMVVRVADPSGRDAVFSIAEAAFANTPDTKRPPQVTVSLLSNPAITAIGTVREIAPMADAATRTFQVKVSLENAPQEMRFGASVSGRAEVAGTPVVVLPGSALFDKDGKPAVWVVTAASGVELRPITVARYETDRVVVSDGLGQGDVVVTAGVNRLREHEKVRIVEGEGQ
ncbi:MULTISPECIES: efflux RND transporter periplasmic adaptor subunit [unclassified Mesorhizobium]|uniref:efflux RND transporter periplasmic adaptor subunit n=1 Tax=unclassified Mesorhizobium TaxID=325217 RepID=UPI000BB09110|nr:MULTISPECIES: efflux RND transporter periplasmic adaptor subunit [unclassified Mesorhizobium]TGT56747.1 efflux RND transporter periplasmic adaptor subunit [Mesorhizobium sp. M00.F.Ca.ET.170.01.1.1]AZO08515.1 efflux RND transporter periplasmic adaptor subunit [Mesorhizobium sp. M3A.F.Ca.ET.080.04.2.1]PBB85390.1 efflux transporter periplasmic adaptor subunit [Mesorhizobium sp. WSM3876]RWB71632.1 MAG: efflux RND transporter periplasmic adaptor subunit [Mesorhizobium sp.]RWB85115.1 MAG: efflux 